MPHDCCGSLCRHNVKPFMIHATFQEHGGMGGKISRFKEAGLWKMGLAPLDTERYISYDNSVEVRQCLLRILAPVHEAHLIRVLQVMPFLTVTTKISSAKARLDVIGKSRLPSPGISSTRLQYVSLYILVWSAWCNPKKLVLVIQKALQSRPKFEGNLQQVPHACTFDLPWPDSSRDDKTNKQS